MRKRVDNSIEWVHYLFLYIYVICEMEKANKQLGLPIKIQCRILFGFVQLKRTYCKQKNKNKNFDIQLIVCVIRMKQISKWKWWVANITCDLAYISGIFCLSLCLSLSLFISLFPFHCGKKGWFFIWLWAPKFKRANIIYPDLGTICQTISTNFQTITIINRPMSNS